MGIKVVVDTNGWSSSNLFTSSMGAAFLYALRQLDARLVLADFQAVEIEAVIGRMVTKAKSDLERSERELRAYVGALRQIEYPSDAALHGVVRNRVAELGELVERTETARETFLEANRRVVQKLPPTPPSGNREEFRDHLLWLTAIELARGGDRTVFVSQDSDFRKSNKSSDLAPELQAEVASLDFEFYDGLESCVAGLEETVPGLDHTRI